ncbi:MAG: TIGR02646 family protein [Candidatus Cloacimonetes bacterium 4572_65]|nr:MAG: TIGR02646 family protein [Candidatus Cloacimonetes bacterium 4572_65]
MRYVHKTSTPKFFIKDTKHLKSWKKYKSHKKRDLKQHILDKEQNHLCIYCESKISLDNSHIEHLRPKDEVRYPQLLFVYRNLTVSCNGLCHVFDNKLTPLSCGHIKGNEFDKNMFLNPVELRDIRDYFVYDFDTYEMKPSLKNPIKAKYMISTLLHLNDEGLRYARRIALRNFNKKMYQIKDKESRKKRMIEVLNRENIAFISFLRYKYRHLLKSALQDM